MDPLYVHLVLNHFPVIGTLIGIALLGLGFASRSDAVKRASLVILLGMAIMTIPVYLTGEPAEERVENAGGVSQPVIEEHEEAAKFAFAAMGFAGIIALGALIMSFLAAKYANFGFAAALVVSLVAFGLIARTASLGGQIRHAEIRADTTATTETESKQKTRERENDHD
jgi:uncharacterized membrane protein